METIEIRTLTPVHVGSGRFLMAKTEYVSGKESYGVVDEKKVLSLIGEEQLGAWVNSIDQGEGLVKFFSGFGIKPELNEISSRKIKIECDKDLAKKLSNLKEQIHNGQGLAYIPGSSIKGAIRSAILNQLIRDKNQSISEQKLKGRNGKYSASNLEKEFFGIDPNHDIFRFLRIGDAYFLKNCTVAIIMDNLNLKGDPNNPDATFDTSKNQLVEAIGKNQSAVSQMKIDEIGIRQNKEKKTIDIFPECFGNIQQLFDLINKNTNQLLDEEIEFWNNYDNDETSQYIEELMMIKTEIKNCHSGGCILRLAHGSGWTFISGNWVKIDNLVQDNDYYKIVDSARPKNNQYYSEYPFPKSRRVSSNMDLLGFIKLQINK